MTTKDYTIAILLGLFILVTFDGCENQRVIKQSKEVIKTLKVNRNALGVQLKAVSSNLKLKIDSIQSEKQKDSLNFAAKILRIERMNSPEVKRILLKDVKPSSDTLEIINFTLRESKEVVRKLLNQEGFISQQGFKIQSYQVENQSLSRSIVLKDQVIETFQSEIVESGIIFKQYKRKKRKQIVKVGLISFGIGAVLVAVLK